ncbi:MAG: twin-arginine translocation signal domain-containing protein [Ginsengibacter sp.]
MKVQDNKTSTNRRNFLGTLAMGAGALTMASLSFPAKLAAHSKQIFTPAEDPEEWFKKIKGKHRMVFDATVPDGIMPMAWPRVFLMTNQQTGSDPKDCTAVVILRHEAIPYGLNDSVWEKYKLGDMAKINDPKTGSPAARNIFYNPAENDFSVPGIGNVPIGINQLMDDGVMFGICSVALLVNSHVIAKQMNADPDEVHKEMLAAVIPGVQLLPSGVWGINRAQEHGCNYCNGA